MITSKDLPEDLHNFLDSYKLVRRYLKLCRENKIKKTFFKKFGDSIYAFTCAFDFYKTKEGADYWFKISQWYVDYLEFKKEEEYH